MSAKLFKQLFGPQVRIEIVADSAAEAIQWRDYFFNWGALQIATGQFDASDVLNEQERSELDTLPDGVHFTFYAQKDRVIKAFRDAAECSTDWETVTERGGKPARKQKHAELERAAIDRFEAIPSNY